MAVYYKFKSAKNFDSILVAEPYISIANLKERIFSSNKLCTRIDFDLVISHAQTNEDYIDEETIIPRNTSVLIRRIPGLPRKPIVVESKEMKVLEDNSQDLALPSGMLVDHSSSMKHYEEPNFDDFGEDLFAIPEVVPEQPGNSTVNISTLDRAEEDMKIKALVNTPAIDWQCQTLDTSGFGRGFWQGRCGTAGSQQGLGRGGIQSKRPPPGYVCHRCKMPGHFIQHCPTNGDPAFDIKRMKAPTGIPRSMLMADPDGFYVLPSGAVAVLKPNEAAFYKEIEGLPTSCTSISDLPVELCCPLCKRVMTDAVLTSKCCFRSFCDKCIRDQLISKSVCLCGATNMLADDLIPNKTLRETISHMLVSRSSNRSSSSANSGSRSQVQDVQSASHVEPRNAPPTLSAVSKDELNQPPVDASTSNKGDGEVTTESNHATQLQEKSAKHVDLLEASSQPRNEKEPILHQSAPTSGVVQGKVLNSEKVKKKRKRRTNLDGDVSDMLSSGFIDSGAENCAGYHPFLPGSYNPYWTYGGPGVIDGYMSPFMGNMSNMSYMGYPTGAFDVWSQYGAQSNLPFPQRESSVDWKSTSQVMRSSSEASRANLRPVVTTRPATTVCAEHSNQVARFKDSCRKQNAAAHKDLDDSAWSRRERGSDLKPNCISSHARASLDSSIKRDKECNTKKRESKHSAMDEEEDERHFKRRW